MQPAALPFITSYPILLMDFEISPQANISGLSLTSNKCFWQSSSMRSKSASFTVWNIVKEVTWSVWKTRISSNFSGIPKCTMKNWKLRCIYSFLIIFKHGIWWETWETCSAWNSRFSWTCLSLINWVSPHVGPNDLDWNTRTCKLTCSEFFLLKLFYVFSQGRTLNWLLKINFANWYRSITSCNTTFDILFCPFIRVCTIQFHFYFWIFLTGQVFPTGWHWRSFGAIWCSLCDE
jgi:hypothetical protein